MIRNVEYKPLFPWFGGKSSVADLVWSRLGDVQNYVEPFFGSGAVLFLRPGGVGHIETVNDADGFVCLAPGTRILDDSLRWKQAGEIKAGDNLYGFDEFNPCKPKTGLGAPSAYRKWKISTVLNVRRTTRPSYRLEFDDGTVVVASEDHQWLSGSGRNGASRAWKWKTTKQLVANRRNQCSWLLKVAPVAEQEETWEAGWLGGFYDGEGHLTGNSGWHLMVSQNAGPALDRAVSLVQSRGFQTSLQNKKRCKYLRINGGRDETLRFLMLTRPERLISKLRSKIAAGGVSLYARNHHAVGLIKKEFLGEMEVVAIETDTHTFIAEGLASHNCNFWRAMQHDSEEVAVHADNPVNEADLHARHLWLIGQRESITNRLCGDPEFYDAKAAGWWAWGQCCWIGSGWCSGKGPWQSVEGEMTLRNPGQGVNRQRPHLSDAGKGVNRKRQHLGDAGQGVNRQLPHLGDPGKGVNRKLPHLGNPGKGVNRKRPHLGDSGMGVNKKRPMLGGNGVGVGVNRIIEADSCEDRANWLRGYLADFSARLRMVRVCCGDWSRVCGPSVTFRHGMTGVFLDPPYGEAASRTAELYATDCEQVSIAVQKWAVEQGRNPLMRICLAGYEGEHAMPDDWSVDEWEAVGGYGLIADDEESTGRSNKGRERLWFSPACLKPTRFVQRSLLS